jgi:hypothetical protein
MKWKRRILAAAVLALIPPGISAADDQSTATDSPWPQGDRPVFTDGQPRADGEPMFLTRGQSPYDARRDVAARFGWWFTNTTGDLTKINEYQRVESSPFWDVDGLLSDADRTANFYATGTDKEGTDVGLNYFGGPGLSANFGYERFYRRLDHNPLTFFDDTDGNGSYIGAHDDLNTGETYAIRVQELHANFKGRLTDNVRWRLNLWGLRKQGERQENALNHNCDGQQCHLQSQRQTIDWLTMEIEPVVEANLGPVTAEYSRTMRSFNQDDEAISRGAYSSHPPVFIDPDAQHPYAVVPENFTQIDRLKLGADLTANNRLYGNLFTGDTENKDRDTHRHFWGADLRLTNRSIDGLSITPYFKYFDDQGQLPTTFPEDDIFQDGHKPSDLATPEEPDGLRPPVDREITTAGVRARWYPLRRRYSSRGLSLTGAYEYEEIRRANVTYFLNDRLADIASMTSFTQPTTINNVFHAGLQERWSETLDTFIRYKMLVTRNPLFGFRENQEGDVLDEAINTNQPEHEDLVELGGTWTPAYNFLLSASIGIDNHHHSSPYAYFDEDSYPFVITAWYAPTTRWSLSAGYANFSNFIFQDITIGTDHPIHGGGVELADTTLWDYRSTADVVNLGASYAATERLRLSGSVEYVRGQDIFTDPSIPGVLDLQYLSAASDVLVETWRLALGIDYWLARGVSCYFHYNYFDYGDKSVDYNSGTGNMFLGGLTAVR